MNINMIFKIIAMIASVVGMVALTGCSTYTSLVQEEGVTIERVNSDRANITRAYLQTSGATMLLRGELKRRFPGRGPIPGHLHIELIGPDGAVFKEANIGYKRNSVKSSIAKFYLAIPGDFSDIKSVRIIHHDLRSHMVDVATSPWRDVNQTK